ncbi:ABC transporter permease [Flavihumibacter sp. UBA7668]|uniref:ABC transporter permease n=1 Tax=Flavihumibacter sp. UBA7668 TaxID=1946542 RepID=UPI0025B8C3A0|nr:ABC transporter permease [Flavihumibacter sp. UBA7668]
MNKTFIIIQREFLSRVKKKTFLLSTILLPILIFGLYGLIIYFSVKGEDNIRVAIVDSKGQLEGKLQSDPSLEFSFLKQADKASLEQDLKDKKYSGYIIMPDSLGKRDSLQYHSRSNVGLMTQGKIERSINKALEKNSLQQMLAPGVTLSQVDSNKTSIDLKIEKSDGKAGNAGFATALGFICGFLIYIVLFIYGSMVMRGVMEEKTNRIAEVMVSSVKPYQLMIGKIVGIGAVGLVQFLIWGVLMMSLQLLLPVIFPEMLDQAGTAGAMAAAGGGKASMVSTILNNMQSVNMAMIIFLFIVYFLGGYLLYSSLFAAVGSAVNEDPQDAQQLMLPITMPIIFAFVIMTQAINNPDGGLAIFGSLFPLTSPIVMMARIPYGVPAWQLILSIALLIGGFLGTTWLAAKIYRTGILMYGKKVTWKELLKWARA